MQIILGTQYENFFHPGTMWTPVQSVIECRTVKKVLLIMVVELYHIAKSRSPRVLWLYLELEALYGEDDRFPELKLTREVIQ